MPTDESDNECEIIGLRKPRPTIDCFELMKNDMRNFRKLDEHQITYIRSLSYEQIREMFLIYNECMELVNEIMK